jgi:putative Mg2+ transporter-C (MgtC) family protein
MLVALASCAFTIVAIEMVDAIGEKMPSSVNTDPTRVIEAGITGVAFLGAGTIIQARGNVIGITTGASIWLAGAIGLASGGGYYLIAVITLALALVTLTALGRLERRMPRKGRDGER